MNTLSATRTPFNPKCTFHICKFKLIKKAGVEGECRAPSGNCHDFNFHHYRSRYVDGEWEDEETEPEDDGQEEQDAATKLASLAIKPSPVANSVSIINTLLTFLSFFSALCSSLRCV